MATSTSTNSVDMPAYPGWNLPLDYRGNDPDDNEVYPFGVQGHSLGVQGNPGAETKVLTVREVAMMLVMDRLTDKPDWHIKVFDDKIAEKWKEETLAWPEEDLWMRASVENSRGYRPRPPQSILDAECVDYCIQELREKAEHFKRTRITPYFGRNFQYCQHPNTDEKVQDLVHPSMYPLVYGRTRFFEKEVVGVDDAIDKYAGKGDVILGEPVREGKARQDNRSAAISTWDCVPEYYWSTTYQWLPSNLGFTDDGAVRFTSYINNLHPIKHRSIYKTIEKFIEIALPMWDQCLTKYAQGTHYGPGRHDPRIPYPEEPDDENPCNRDPPSVEEMIAREAADEEVDEEANEEANKEADEKKDEASNEAADEEAESEPDQPETSNEEGSEDWTSDDYENDDRWKETREPAQRPMPAFEAGKVNYSSTPDSTLYHQFRNKGLQIIVKIASVELTPEKPEFAPGGWHVEGMMNERIAGTVLYYLDSENITDSYLDFRAMTPDFDTMYHTWKVGQDSYRWLESVYGRKLGAGGGSPCHRVSGFKLADPTKPGHRRFIALWLVDPTTRIISTANVPPQQADWWAERAFGVAAGGSKEALATFPSEIAQLLVERGLGGERLGQALAGGWLATSKLPLEVIHIVRKELGDALPMSRKEAEEHRLKLMVDRTATDKAAENDWQEFTYFCEH
ncbi:hypothetical protein C7999DRAFT_35299 [Corynascus novoguineensis]|uniref:Uncharacterized protein n=1 Tax=Corynascus novoguineensis TaxID=1126955 RepID=A0AAN7CLN5_9PEZI|nr:hypothetical protein C7999DRAFT_35299 [Corynascus novoguineensis]